MKQEPRTFEEKIKITFTKYARILMTFLFAILVLIIGFERVVKPKFNTFQTNRKIANSISNLDNVVDNVLINIETVYSTSSFYETYYSKLISKGIKGDISIYDEDKDIIFLTNSFDEGTPSKKIFNQYFINNIISKDGEKITSSTRRSEDQAAYNDLVYGSKVVRNDNSIVYVIIYIDSDWLGSYIESVQPSLVVITDKQNYTIASTSSILVGKYNRFNIEQDTRILVQGREYSIMDASDNAAHLKIHMLTHIDIWPNFLAYIGITFLLVLLINRYASNKVASQVGYEASSSISQLRKMIDKISNGELGATVELDTQDEFKSLAHDFNIMSLALKESIDNNSTLLELQKKAEIKQLEAQFNPHFLYNSLETIRYLIGSDPKLAESLILKNTHLLRYSIESKEELVPFADDFEYIRVFLDIHKIRLAEALTINIDIEEAIFSEMLPKLILLPLIENSIKYGYSDQDSLNISIIGRIIGEELVLSVIDDGQGMDIETLDRFKNQHQARINSASHYGLYSIHHRLNLIYQGQANMSINSKERKTEISLTLPRRAPYV